MNKKSFYLLIFSVLIIGFLSGVVGELWVNGFLLKDPYLNFKSYSDLSQKIDDLVNEDGEPKSLKDEDQRIAQPINKATPAIVSIYKYKKFQENKVDTLLKNDFLGRGVIVASDGWIMTSNTVAANLNSTYYIVDSNNEVYESVEVVTHRDLSISFIKIDQNNLPVIQFSTKKDLIKGQNVVLFGEDGNIKASRIENLVTLENQTLSQFIHSSEDYYNYIHLQNELDSDFIGTPIINLEGEMIGLLVDASGKVLPIDYTFPAMKVIGSDNEYSAPYLGILYYDYYQLLNPTVEMKKGAQITSTGVLANSPAKGILLPNDIITKIENEEINQTKTVSELIAQYQTGDELNFTILREDVEMVVPVELK